MIVQNFLNFIRDFALTWLNGLPPLPPEWQAALTSIHNASVSVGLIVNHLSVLLPMDAIRNVIGFLPALFALYVATTAIRVSTKPFLK